MAICKCSWCNEPGATTRKHDASNAIYWWHPGCWQVQLAWLRGHDGLPNKPGPERDDGPPVRYRGLSRAL